MPPQVRFREHTITDGLKSGYQVVAADVNGDGKPDLIAVDQGSSEIAWYENPGWERHVIATGVPHPINLDAADVDGDGVPEIALLYQFDMDPARSTGIVALLHHNGDVRKPWTLREIDRVPTAHRVRWTSIGGTRAMIMAPLAGAAAKPPEYDAPVPIYLYRSPAWKRELLTDELHGVLHGIHPGDHELITAGFLGVRIFRPGTSGKWRSQEIGPGNPEPCPRCGSSDVAPGKGFIAAIEPWHGNQVVVYREPRRGREGAWERTVIDDSLDDGHALATNDLNGDGNDEIVAGFRGKGHQVYLYSAEDANGIRWKRTSLDPGGMAAANCTIRDLNGDGRPDVICIGSSTHNIKWYENLGP
jgi:FG-GAP-like repeat